jgi:hypothetical protein
MLWWEELTGRGGEGVVVKPWDFITSGRRGVIQPAVKCRGREYLRIIYGPEYTLPANLERLRQRGLGAKRALALREFALGIEALERFTQGEPLRRVHECVFGVLALESEPVDPGCKHRFGRTCSVPQAHRSSSRHTFTDGPAVPSRGKWCRRARGRHCFWRG